MIHPKWLLIETLKLPSKPIAAAYNFPVHAKMHRQRAGDERQPKRREPTDNKAAILFASNEVAAQAAAAATASTASTEGVQPLD